MPTVVRIPATHQSNRRQHGIKIGCCRVCTCKKFRLNDFLCLSVKPKKKTFLGLHLEFLTSKCGLLKIFELLLGNKVNLNRINDRDETFSRKLL